MCSDNYGGISNVSNSVAVQPSHSTISASALSSQLTSALETFNFDVMNQIVGAVATKLNSANCTMRLSCSSIMRLPCSSTAFTCGACLPGTIGVEGDSNQPCYAITEGGSRKLLGLGKIGDACQRNSTCFSLSCHMGQCVDTPKLCLNDCGSSGNCHFFDNKNNSVLSCGASNAYCTARCSCNKGFYGADCSLGQSDWSKRVKLREVSCHNILAMSAVQLVTKDVVASRALSIGSLLADPTQLSMFALHNCTQVLRDTVVRNSLLAANDANYAAILTALSRALNTLHADSAVLAQMVSDAVTALCLGRQQILATGESATQIATPNVRLTCGKVLSASLVQKPTLFSALSSVEEFNMLPASTVGLSLPSEVDALRFCPQVGVAAIEFPFNAQSGESTSRIIRVETNCVNSDVVQSQLDAVPIAVNLNLVQRTHFLRFDPYKVSIDCEPNITTSRVYPNCTGFPKVEATCPGDYYFGYVSVTCPGRYTFPLCMVSSGSTSFRDSAMCKLVSFTNTTAECLCTGSTVNSHATIGDRRLINSGYGNVRVMEYSTITTHSETNPVIKFVDFGAVALEAVEHNAVIYATTSILIILGLG